MDTKKAAQNLMRAIGSPTDEMAARLGEDHLLTKIKRNSDRVQGCERHEFAPQPDWRDDKRGFTMGRITCTRCGGEMSRHDAFTYLRGFAHGSGQDFKVLTDAVWPATPEGA